jgi:hypothetical protein
MFYQFINILKKNKKMYDNENALRKLLYIFFSSWIVFPILFIVGPEGFNLITIKTSMCFHSIGDIFSKNFCGLYMWRIQRVSTSHNNIMTQIGPVRKKSSCIAINTDADVEFKNKYVVNVNDSPDALTPKNSEAVDQEHIDVSNNSASTSSFIDINPSSTLSNSHLFNSLLYTLNRQQPNKDHQYR